MKIKNFGIENEVLPYRTSYWCDGSLAIILRDAEGGPYGEPYGKLTVNLGYKLNKNCAFVDVNNMPGAIKFIEKYKLGEDTGIRERSGFCIYPMYKFNVDMMEEDR